MAYGEYSWDPNLHEGRSKFVSLILSHIYQHIWSIVGLSGAVYVRPLGPRYVAGSEAHFSFGQVLALMLLLIPVLGAFELYYEETQAYHATHRSNDGLSDLTPSQVADAALPSSYGSRRRRIDTEELIENTQTPIATSSSGVARTSGREATSGTVEQVTEDGISSRADTWKPSSRDMPPRRVRTR